MAATMVAMTAKGKNSALTFEKKQGWSIPQLPELRFPWDLHEGKSFSISLDGSVSPPGGQFASVGLKVSTAVPAVTPSPAEHEFKIPFADHCIKSVSSAGGYQIAGIEAESVNEEEVECGTDIKKAKK
ncbi:hypothetical protein GUJ93_ZPchr0012g21706 [Zizania palustris]|uniref:Uncharacterized protein n=1 Tax=Zizania palustris TaxID=103762 RepID=A0A8J5WQT6_ZIZPA|nr:hypothetical protein GUJ93_ZPchr0012g21706 [Zizania palustris]KAG8094696.1 hypothetical protein GUJ93_ZPchr0012g21706 [Zizania palustris]